MIALALLFGAVFALAPPARIVAVGGSVGPDQTPLALERALQPLTALPGRVLLFGGGDPLLPTVQVEPGPPGDALRETLGRVLGQPAGLGSHYRPARLGTLEGPARRAALRAALSGQARALQPGQLLLLVGVGHGDLAAEGSPGTELLLWGDERLRVEELASWLDQDAPRASVAAVLGHCYGGDFARLSYRGAEPGAPLTPRCALLATTADRLADGCSPRGDAGPSFVERASQMLARGDRRLDLDRNGALDLEELHAALRLQDRSLNLPVLSHENVLRDLVPLPPLAEVEHLELRALRTHAGRGDAAVMRGLHGRTGLSASTRVRDLDDAVARAAAAVDAGVALHEEIFAVQEAARLALVDRVAARWPELLNPFRSDFESVLERARPGLETLLTRDPAAHRYREAGDELQRAEVWLAELERHEAQLLRLQRAVDNTLLWRELRRRNPELEAELEPVLACERGALAPVR